MGRHSAPPPAPRAHRALRGALGAVLVTAAVAVSALAITGVPATVAQTLFPADDTACVDLADLAAAQALLAANPDDPQGLDSDGDGRACDELFGDDVIVPPSDAEAVAVEPGKPNGGGVPAK